MPVTYTRKWVRPLPFTSMGVVLLPGITSALVLLVYVVDDVAAQFVVHLGSLDLVRTAFFGVNLEVQEI